MSLVLENCSVITGDGETVFGDARIIVDASGAINGVGEDLRLPKDYADFQRVDLEGRLVVPGVINHHEHHVTFGPNIMGDITLTEEQVIQHLDRHLAQGTTSICNVDGFITPQELRRMAARHSINLKTATMHHPSIIKAAEVISGCPRLGAEHRALTIGEMAKNGAVAVGEVEEMTIWGVLTYLPLILRRATGRAVDPMKARALQQAVLGDLESVPEFNADRVRDLLREAGIEHAISPEQVRELLDKIFMLSHREAYTGYKEAAFEARRWGLPMIVHNALESTSWTLELARSHSREIPIIASHCDSITFRSAEEALDNAIKLKRAGATIDCTSYMPGHRDLSDKGIALFKEGLVDVICTDAGGGHDSILYFIERLVEQNLVKLPAAVRMATSNVAGAIPKLAPSRGLVERGRVADLAVVDPRHVGRVHRVMIGGRFVVDDGWKSGAWKSYGVSSPLEAWSPAAS